MLQNLFTLSIKHTYFTYKACDCLKVLPSETTAQVLRQAGLIFRAQTDGFEVYYNSDSTINKLLKDLESDTGMDSFDFEIWSDDVDFIKYTDFPAKQGQLIFSTKDRSTDSTEHNHYLNLHFLQGENVVSNSMGRLTVYFSDLIEMATDRNISLFFQARSIYWKYYVISNTNKNLANAKITNDAGIEFEDPIETQLHDQAAWLFSSGSHAFALSQSPTQELNLSLDGVTKTPLPAPSMESIQVDPSGETDSLVSHMYVYIWEF